MTAPITKKIEARARPREPRNMFEDFARDFEAWLGVVGEWPKPEYQRDPVAFARDVLGYTPCRTIDDVLREHEEAIEHGRAATLKILTPDECEILDSIVPENAKIAVHSGHKTGKTHTEAIAALWFFCSFPDARVVCTAVSLFQVAEVIWREVRKQLFESVTRIECDVAERPQTGIKGSGFREILGFTAREAEAVAGVSGAHILYIIDEASGVPERIFEAIYGNRMGGARIAMFSNPTQTSGEFFDACNKKKESFRVFHLSSEKTVNYLTGRKIVPGLATRDIVEEYRRDWGVDSVKYRIRIKGEFVLNEDAKIISFHHITYAVKRWVDAEKQKVTPKGRLFIGFDPAGPGSAGDESVFVPRRGDRALQVHRFRGQTDQALLVQLLGIVSTYRRKEAGELPPVVVLDRSGPIGIKVARTLVAHLDSQGHENDFELVCVTSSDKATDPLVRCDRIRDQLWWRLGEWIRDGGAIPPDERLQRELHAPRWFTPPGKDLLKATSKDDMRKILDGQSPDAADALALSVWEARGDEVDRVTRGAAPDPYAGASENAYDLGEDARAVSGGEEDPVYGGVGRGSVYGE